MEEFNYQLNEPHQDIVQQWRNDFNTTDVDQGLFEGQENFLGTMEPISDASCPDSTAFLNPINDILTDINDFNRNFCCETFQPSLQTNVQSVVPLSCAWNLPEGNDTASLSSYIHLQETLKTDTDLTSLVGMDQHHYSTTAGNDNATILLPGSNADYTPPEYSFFGADYSTTINQWLQNLEQQPFTHSALSGMAVLPPPHQLQQQAFAQAPPGYSDSLLNTIGSLPASTTITPITIKDEPAVRCQSAALLPSTEQDVSIEACYLQNNSDAFISSSRNVMPINGERGGFLTTAYQLQLEADPQLKLKTLPSLEPIEWCSGDLIAPETPTECSDSEIKPLIAIGNQPAFPQNLSTIQLPGAANSQKKPLQWDTVFPRKHFIQPPEVIVMHPLRTRKSIITGRPMGTKGNGKSSTIVSLSEYFDTSCINIPMIKDRGRAECKSQNRRKQKHNIIPGSENLVFEVQKQEPLPDVVAVLPAMPLESVIPPNGDPYTETDLVELDEIFKRKKKSTTTTAVVGPYKKVPMFMANPGSFVSSTPKQTTENQSTLVEFSTFEEQISSIPMTANRIINHLHFNKQGMSSSESDFIASDEEKEELMNTIKSLKCQKCGKFYKSSRSLAIHTKRCTSVSRDSASSCSEIVEEPDCNPKAICNQQPIVIQQTRPLQNVQSEESSEETETAPAHGLNKARPLTRSQTRQSAKRPKQ